MGENSVKCEQNENLQISLPRIIDDTFKELLYVKLEQLEVGIDYFLDDNNVLKDIPVIGVISSFIKTGVSIHNRIFVEKLFSFIGSVKNELVADEEKKSI